MLGFRGPCQCRMFGDGSLWSCRKISGPLVGVFRKVAAQRELGGLSIREFNLVPKQSKQPPAGSFANLSATVFIITISSSQLSFLF